VLAHERFLADRENFAGLDLAARFERIERTNLWDAATSVSGLGSEDPATAAIREALAPLLQRLGALAARCALRRCRMMDRPPEARRRLHRHRRRAVADRGQPPACGRRRVAGPVSRCRHHVRCAAACGCHSLPGLSGAFELCGVAVGAIADPDFPAPVRSVFEQSKHAWVEIGGAGVAHFEQGAARKSSS